MRCVADEVPIEGRTTVGVSRLHSDGAESDDESASDIGDSESDGDGSLCRGEVKAQSCVDCSSDS